MIVLRKEIEVTSGQQKLFDDEPCFFYITNASKTNKSTRQVVSDANKRCDQENLISQLKACGALTAPLDTLLSNGAYMAIAALAWSLKIWSGLLIQPSGPPQQQEKQQASKREILRMEFQTYRQRLMQLPAQIIRRSRQLVYRLLSYRESIETLLLIHQHVHHPLRC